MQIQTLAVERPDLKKRSWVLVEITRRPVNRQKVKRLFHSTSGNAPKGFDIIARRFTLTGPFSGRERNILANNGMRCCCNWVE
jgi:hypothetical protein